MSRLGCESRVARDSPLCPRRTWCVATALALRRLRWPWWDTSVLVDSRTPPECCAPGARCAHSQEESRAASSRHVHCLCICTQHLFCMESVRQRPQFFRVWLLSDESKRLRTKGFSEQERL